MNVSHRDELAEQFWNSCELGIMIAGSLLFVILRLL